MNDLLELMQARYSERNFDPEKAVEKEKIEKLIEAARLAPTARNLQAFHLYVLSGEKGAQILNSFNAPTHILITAKKDEAWVRKEDSFNAANLDIGIVGTHIVLEAKALGLETCIIGYFEIEETANKLELPEDEHPIMVIALGYPSEKSKPSERHNQRKSKEELTTIIA